MNTTEAENFALAETVARLKQLPKVRFHDPICSCDNPKLCPNIVTGIEPTEHAIQPMKDYKQAVAEMTKVNIKKLLKKKLSVTTEPLDYVFLTINPDTKKVAVGDFISKFLKFIPTKIFTDYCGVIEQRGTVDNDNIGSGYHCHILFKRNTPLSKGLPPTNIKQKIRESWKNFTNTKDEHLCNIQFIDHPHALEKLEYMLGIKTKSGKDLKQEGDRLWRPTLNIEAFYGNSGITDI